MRYYLIGMMLAGKSTIGKLVSEKYNLNFVDLDEYIEFKEQKNINYIFNEFGEAHFRALETKYLKEIELDNTIIALGGGTPLYNKLSGVKILLNPSLDDLLNRINDKEISIRPLLQDPNKFIEIYNNRINRYISLADYVINDTNIAHIVSKIGMIINEKNISN